MLDLDGVNWMSISYQELEMILQENRDLTNAPLNDSTPLCTACLFNREDLVTVLLFHGADLNKHCWLSGKLPFHFACDHSHGNIGIVRKLIEANADINSIASDGSTGLHLACSNSNLAVAQLLISMGANVNLLDDENRTPLSRACFVRNLELITLLLENGSDPNIHARSVLGTAILCESEEMMKLLVNAGVSLHETLYFNLAVQFDNIEMMKVLYSAGVDINMPSDFQITPLHDSCLEECSDLCTSLLLQWGARTDLMTDAGETALCYAVRNCKLGKLRNLLAYGAKVNACDLQCLFDMICVNFDTRNIKTRLRVFRLLLAAGVKLNRKVMNHLRMVLDVDRSPACEELNNLIKTQHYSALSLQFLCRISIRSCMRPNIDVNMKVLPLPKNVIGFLNFDDIS